ncbi:MAG: AAA domain-containing protein [Undibacterium umbellatum]|uniref:AAA domain-containing protein n=1 Tax=Undibacterium umbellatum TaxID=2762300 RepID=UPI003BB64B4D
MTNNAHLEMDLEIDNWLIVRSAPISGGMSWVYRVTEGNGDRYMALKIPRLDASPSEVQLAFQRESKALSNLAHPNIVRLQHFGHSKQLDCSYLLLEWLGKDLTSLIESNGPWSWVNFYEEIGRPILDALRHAHTRHVVHRDLKPQNILLRENGSPVITDFGIARLTAEPQLGRTFSQAGTPPYTPPEQDNGIQSEQRDIYSFGAITLACLCGRTFKDLGEMQQALNRFSAQEFPKKTLERALSLTAHERQENAAVLLSELDSFHQDCMIRLAPAQEVFLQWTTKCEKDVKEIFGDLELSAAKDYLIADLNDCCGASIFDDEDNLQIELIGSTLRLVCSLERVRKDRFTVERIQQLSAARAQQIRDEFIVLKNTSFTFRPPSLDCDPNKITSRFILRLRVNDEERARREAEKHRNRWFDCWATYLQEKERFHKGRQVRLRVAKLVPSEGQKFVATIEDEFSSEEIGESLVIQQKSGRPLIFAVDEINVDQLVLSLQNKGNTDIPRGSIFLESNVEAELQAIGKQRTALEELKRERAINPRIKQIISDPSVATAPEPAGLKAPENLSADKHEILDSALGVTSVFAVKGPPGTGKTTLIAELIVEYLRRFPDRRVLLSSQTHVALDHVIAKLRKFELSEKIVRIVSNSSRTSRKIDVDVQDLTLSRKTRKWCETVEARAKDFIDAYANKYGADSTELKVHFLGASLIRAKDIRHAAEKRIEAIAVEEIAIDQKRKEVLEKSESPDRDRILAETTYLVDERVQLKELVEAESMRIARLSQQLKELGEFGNEVLNADRETAVNWLDALDTKDEKGLHIKRAIELQLEWIDRLGVERSFQSAVLSEASVVAGTCVGLASTPAIYQDEYDLCIIDEASKATATEALVPLVRSKTAVLVGDPKQLPPFFEDKSLYELEGYEAEEAKTTLLSLFLEHLPEANKMQLREQRRMTFTIGEMVSKLFYEGSLDNVRPDSSRSKVIRTTFPKPVKWISTSRKNARERSHGRTFSNPVEVDLIVSSLKRLIFSIGRSKEVVSVAIIAAYAGQVRALQNAIDQAGSQLSKLVIEVNTIDAFQGKEADVCFYSVTRSNSGGFLGFQRERPRINVALSRARDALIIVGDDEFCASVKGENPFLPVLEYIYENPDFCELNQA